MPHPKVDASIFNSDADLGVLGDAYKQYQNTNPNSDQIVNFVSEFASSKAYKTSFLVTKHDDEHIIWSLGEIMETDGTSLLIAPVVSSSTQKFTKTILLSKKSQPEGLEFSSAVEEEKIDRKDINDYFQIKAFHLSLGKDEHADRILIFLLPKQSKNVGNKDQICEIIEIQITYVTDTWQNDYNSYLARDYGAPSYLGATINHVFDSYLYCYSSDGTYTIVTDIDGNGGLGSNTNSSSNGDQGVPVIGPDDRVPTPCLEGQVYTFSVPDYPPGDHSELTVAGLEVNFGHPDYIWHVNLNIPVLCISVHSPNFNMDPSYVQNIVEITLHRTLTNIQQQYREGEFDDIINTGLLNNEFSRIFRQEAHDATPSDISIDLDMNNFCPTYQFNSNTAPLSVAWDC